MKATRELARDLAGLIRPLFKYRGHRVEITFAFVGHGGYRGVAAILKKDCLVEQVRTAALYPNPQLAVHDVEYLARAWIDRRRALGVQSSR
jgi:hypothetical protein